MTKNTKDGDQPERNYEVGYGKPPVQHRFKPGASAKSPGRPKGSRSTQQEVAALLNGSMTVRIGGREKKMNRRKALVQSLFDRAAKGNNRAAEILLKLDAVEPTRVSQADARSSTDVSAQDLKILEAFGFTSSQDDDQ